MKIRTTLHYLYIEKKTTHVHLNITMHTTKIFLENLIIPVWQLGPVWQESHWHAYVVQEVAVHWPVTHGLVLHGSSSAQSVQIKWDIQNV